MDQETVVRSEFDRILSTLHDLPDVTRSAPSTIRSVDFIGISRTFIVTTYRMREKGDTVFLESIGPDGSLRLVLPPAVVDAIVRQRDALTTKVRRKIGKANAEERKRRGEPLPFLRKKGAK